MTLYCVRMAANHLNVPDEIVGIFSVRSLVELEYFVSEVCPPNETEYAVLPSGGMIWEGRGPKIADLYRLDEETEECVAVLGDERMSVSQQLQDAFSDGLRFKPLCPVNPQNKTGIRGRKKEIKYVP